MMTVKDLIEKLSVLPPSFGVVVAPKPGPGETCNHSNEILELEQIEDRAILWRDM